MKQYKPLALVAAMFLLIGAVSPDSAEKELIIRLQGEVIVLQRQVRDMQEFLDKWQARSSDSLNKISGDMATTARGVTTLEESVKTSQLALRNNTSGTTMQMNKIAEQVALSNQQTAQVRQQLETLQKTIQEFQNKLENKEKNEISGSAAMLDDPDYLFATAYTQFSRKNYETAISLFTQYLQRYGRSERADDALFWTAESFFAQGRYDEALRHYEQALTSFPKGDKAPAAYFKKGMSLLRLERRDEGTSVLKSLLDLYPGSPEAVSARDELRRLGARAPAPSAGSAPNTKPSK